MKNIISGLAFLILAGTVSAQVGIGRDNITNASVLLEFEDNNAKGIIVPVVENTSKALSTNQSDNNGTFLFDKSDKIFKLYSNDSWISLTDAGSIGQRITNTAPEQVTVGVIIGSDTTPTQGALVLNHPTRAMVLPKVADPHLNVKQPYPGMMCYDTTSKSLAVFNGENWYYWK